MRTTLVLALAAALGVGCGGEEPGQNVHRAELGGGAPEHAVLKPEGLATRLDIPVHARGRVHQSSPDVVPEDVEPALPCPMGLTSCGGDCVDLHCDPDHCGACYEACETQVCLMGMCMAPPVP